MAIAKDFEKEERYTGVLNGLGALEDMLKFQVCRGFEREYNIFCLREEVFWADKLLIDKPILNHLKLYRSK
jgi:hypothetical protein